MRTMHQCSHVRQLGPDMIWMGELCWSQSANDFGNPFEWIGEVFSSHVEVAHENHVAATSGMHIQALGPWDVFRFSTIMVAYWRVYPHNSGYDILLCVSFLDSL